MVAIPITRSISIDDSELIESTTRSGGPGGQHVNTTDSAVILRFDVGLSPGLPLAVKNRIAAHARRRAGAAERGIAVATAQPAGGPRAARRADQGRHDRPQGATRDQAVQGGKGTPRRYQEGAQRREGGARQGPRRLSAGATERRSKRQNIATELRPKTRHPSESWGILEERAMRANMETPAFAGVTD